MYSIPIRFVQRLNETTLRQCRRIDAVNGDDDVADAKNVAPLSPRTDNQVGDSRLRFRRTGGRLNKVI